MVGLRSRKKPQPVQNWQRGCRDGRSPMLVACDIYRPAAIDQLEILAKQEDFHCRLDRNSSDVTAIARAGWEQSKTTGSDLVIFDTPVACK